jgi:hypothetical protein
MFFIVMLNCIAMGYEHPFMEKSDLDYQILHWA